ncbi:MAG: GNAT family N-acetyltransferase, partial [Gammaproteobacteria bacterium]
MNTSNSSQASKGPMEKLVVRFVEPRDAGAVRALFRKIFNEDMSQRHWEWKYLRPQSRAVVVYKDDALLAHYGGVGRDIILEGKKSTAMQIADLMVDPDVRHAVRSRSPFYLSGKMFLESTVGYDNDFLLAYGFPSDRAMGLSERIGFFAPVGRMMEVR